MRRLAFILPAAATVAVAVFVVFSPLVAALAGTGLGARGLSAALDGLAKPMGRSDGMAAAAAAVALVLGLPFAVLVDRCRVGVRRACWAAGLAALVVPPYVVAEAWVVLLGPAGKVSKPVAVWLGFGPPKADPTAAARYAVPGYVYSWTVAGVVMGGCLFPVVALAVAAAWRRTDRRTFESARLARGRRGVAEVAARVVLPPAVGGSLLVLAVALTEFAVPQLLRVTVVGDLVYEAIQAGDLAAAAAVCLPVLPVIVVAGAVGVAVLGRSRAANVAGLEGEVPTFEGRTAGPAGHVAAVVATVAATAPALLLPAASLTWLAVAARLPAPTAGGTHNVLRASGFVDSFAGAWELVHADAIRTVVWAAVGATLATAFAVAVARLAPRVRGGWAVGVLAAGLAVPAPVVALGLIVLWNREGAVASAVYGSAGVVLLGWFARFFPLVVVLVGGGLARVPVELEEAAALAGRGPAERLVGVVLRGAAPALAAGVGGDVRPVGGRVQRDDARRPGRRADARAVGRQPDPPRARPGRRRLPGAAARRRRPATGRRRCRRRRGRRRSAGRHPKEGPMTDVLRLDHVGRSFGSATVLADVSLTLAAGDRLAVLGSSGSGKTTLLRLIAGLDVPTAGEGRHRRAGRSPAPVPCSSRRSGGRSRSSSRGWPCSPTCGRSTRSRSPPAAAAASAARETCSPASASATVPTPASTSSPAANASGSPWPARWRRSRGCC